MDRYQFKDLISDYIENNLSLNQRQQVEAYLQLHPDANGQIESVKHVIASLKSLPLVSTSDYFMDTLYKRISAEKEKKPIIFKRSFAGYTPLMAGLSSVVVILVIMLGMEFIPSEKNRTAVQPFITEQEVKTPVNYPAQMSEDDIFVEIEEDSTIIENQSDETNFENRIQLVNDQHQ